MRGRRRSRVGLLLAVLGVCCVGVLPGAALAKQAAAKQVQGEAPTNMLTVDRATVVDPATAPKLESPALPSGAFINRPELPLAQYRQAKQTAAGAGRTATRPQQPTPFTTALSIGGNGQNQGAPGANLVPPDSAGAAGGTQLVQALNSKLAVYNMANPPGLLCANSFATLTGYSTQTLFDPRVVYDSTWKRRVVEVEAFPESATVQRQFILISRTANACGPFIVYNFNINYRGTSSFFWDFPDLGITQDSAILTANEFSGNSFVGSVTFGIAKAILYNGLGFSVPLFTNLGSTLAPPIVLDQNPCAFLVQPNVNTATVDKRAFCNSGNAFFGSVSGAASIAVSNTISVPPNATQPGCSATSSCSIDTSDGRFSSQTWQLGNDLWAVHTITLSGLPTPKYYQFNTNANTVTSQAFFFNNNGRQDDFNPSIGLKPSGTIFVSWNSSGPNAGQFVDVRVGGKTSAGSFSQKVAVTGAASLTGNFDPNFGAQRWGDYSNTWPTQGTASLAWGFDERVNDASTWGTRLQRFAQS